MKNLVREILVFTSVFLTLPLWLPVMLGRTVKLSDDTFATCSQIIGALPGMVGIFLRRGFYWMTLDKCSRDCSIGCATWLSHPQVAIGRRVYIGGRCNLGMCRIGDDVLIGDNVDILSGRRQHKSEDRNIPRNAQGGAFMKIRIGNNAWIGNSAVVMADVGDNTIIGAGSVVVKPIPANSVAVGNPATVKKTIQ